MNRGFSYMISNQEYRNNRGSPRMQVFSPKKASSTQQNTVYPSIPPSKNVQSKNTVSSCCSNRALILKLFSLISISALGIICFGSSFSVSYQALDDLLINEKWREPNTESKHTNLDILSGRTEMMKTNVTFLGVGRNLGPRLPVLLSQIEILADSFHYSRAIFVEGGSIDNTKQIFERWSKASHTNRTLIIMQDDEKFETNGYFKGLHTPREGRLSNARNVGLRELHRQVQQTGVKTEYVIVVDLDVLGWDPHGVADSFKKVGHTTSWDVICANGILLHGLYRDTYAFRTDKINTNHHWAGNDDIMYNITIADKKRYRINLKVITSVV